MGCGYVYYKGGKWSRKLYVCNYGPAGNVITLPMYKRGDPCSDCPDGTSCSSSFPGLCSGPALHDLDFSTSNFVAVASGEGGGDGDDDSSNNSTEI